MAVPPDLPTVRHYADGRQVLVTSMAEFDALEPGHGDNPLGPFDEPEAAQEAPAVLRETIGGRAARARKLYVAGRSQRTIATELGVSRRTVQTWLKEDDHDDC